MPKPPSLKAALPLPRSATVIERLETESSRTDVADLKPIHDAVRVNRLEALQDVVSRNSVRCCGPRSCTCAAATRMRARA